MRKAPKTPRTQAPYKQAIWWLQYAYKCQFATAENEWKTCLDHPKGSVVLCPICLVWLRFPTPIKPRKEWL